MIMVIDDIQKCIQRGHTYFYNHSWMNFMEKLLEAIAVYTYTVMKTVLIVSLMFINTCRSSCNSSAT